MRKMESDSTSKRSGSTQVTSVSVSKEFSKIIAQHNLSPTECFRRGVAVTLCDLGVGMYQSPKNEERSKFMQEFLKKMDDDEKLKADFEKVEDFMAIKKHLNSINKIMEDIKNE
jgi:hypothetical protein